jgi:hypothetical protein
MAEVNHAQRKFAQILNSRESQYPPDTLWIRQQKQVLVDHVRNPSLTKTLSDRATPR